MIWSHWYISRGLLVIYRCCPYIFESPPDVLKHFLQCVEFMYIKSLHSTLVHVPVEYTAKTLSWAGAPQALCDVSVYQVQDRGAIQEAPCTFKSVKSLIHSYCASNCFIKCTLWTTEFCGLAMLNILEKYWGHSPYNNFRWVAPLWHYLSIYSWYSELWSYIYLLISYIGKNYQFFSVNFPFCLNTR